MEKDIYVKYMEGGKISIGDIKNLLINSYKTKPDDIQNYDLDTSLSDPRVQVYKKKDNSNDVVVVHRGTKGINDWLTNVKMFFGVKDKRFKHAEDIQKKAEKKYGKKNVTTVGHSLGSKIAEEVGGDSHEVITLNKPTLPLDLIKKGRKKQNKQVDIKTVLDPVSVLKPLEQSNDKVENITIPSKSLNPLDEHTVETLERLDPNLMVGAGQLAKLKKKDLKKYIKGKNKKLLVTGLNKQQLLNMAKTA